MLMNQGDELVGSCCLFPADAVRRNALADWLTENGEEDLGRVVSGDAGEKLLESVAIVAMRMKRQPSMMILFAVRHVFNIALTIRPPVVIRHPAGYIVPGDPGSGTNRDLAIMLADHVVNGSVLVLPDTRNGDGTPGWSVQWERPDWSLRPGIGDDGSVATEAT